MKLMREIAADCRGAARLSWHKLQKRRAIIATVPVASCLVIGLLSGYKVESSIAAGSAFTVGFGAFNALGSAPVLSMALTSLFIATATIVGSLCGLTPTSLFLASAAVGILAGTLFAAGEHASWVGLQSATFFVVAAAFPLGSKYAFLRGAIVLAGGAAQVIFYMCFWLLEPAGGLDRSIKQWRRGARNRGRQIRDAAYFRSPPVQHGIRLAIVICMATYIYRRFSIRDGYWIPMTALLILRPNWSVTRSRGLARMGGTLLGAGFASLLVLVVSDSPFVLLLLTIAFALGCFSLQQVSYALFCCVLTFYVVSLLAFDNVVPHRAILLRLLCTLIGGVISLIVDGLWPKSLQSDEAMAQPEVVR